MVNNEFKRIFKTPENFTKQFAKNLGISPISLTRYIYSKRFPEKKF